MSKLKKLVCLFIAAWCAVAFTSCTAQNKKNLSQPVPSSLCKPEQRTRQKRQGDIFVSPTGRDSDRGTAEEPVRTVQRAVFLARQLQKEEKVIFLEDGNYDVSSMVLDQEDSGITFFAERNAVLDGGVSLRASDFTPYRDGILVLDLKKYGVTKERIGTVRAFGQYHTAEKYDAAGSLYCELFCDGQRMTLARYPNEGRELETGDILDNGDSREVYTKSGTQTNGDWEKQKFPRGGTFRAEKELTTRIKSWKNSPDVWLFGCFQYDWADSSTPLKTVGDDSITTEYASVYGFKKGMPYYFFNVFEEMDAEKEWYIDLENLLLYFIPPKGFEQKEIRLSLETNDLFQLDHARNITFDGITLTGTRASAIKGTGNHIVIRDCSMKNIGENAVDLKGSHITVENNEITGTGKAGVVLEGGDRKALVSSENVVTNNRIFHWSQVYQTYQAAVALHGVGGVCSHNEIYNAPHEAITYTGNNHTIEYNVIHDVVLKSSDAGAIYAGRSWSSYGNIIRYNCIYNIGSGEFKPNGIYFDDALSGQQAYGNLLVNIPGSAFLIGGGRDMDIRNNMIVNAGIPIFYDDRAIAGIKEGGWFTHANTPESSLWMSLKEVDVASEPWKQAYPALSKLTDDFKHTDAPSFAANPADSTVAHNLILNQKKDLGEIAKRVKKYSTISENRLYALNADLFTGPGTYVLKTPEEGFEALPLEKMGRYYEWTD